MFWTILFGVLSACFFFGSIWAFTEAKSHEGKKRFMYNALGSELLIFCLLLLLSAGSYGSDIKFYHYILEIEKPPYVLAEEAMQPGEMETRKTVRSQIESFEKAVKEMHYAVAENKGLSKATISYLHQLKLLSVISKELEKFVGE
jgi:hypothetical protein